MNKLHSWISPKLEVRKIPNLGNGIFAKTNIAKDELLTIFGGYVMTVEEVLQLPLEIRDYVHQITPDFLLGIFKIEDVQPSDFFNHSCDPNAGFNGQIFLVATREINEGEQVVFDYAQVLSMEHYDIECLCGSKNCRGRITGSDWKIKEVRERNKGYFQPYLEDMIKNESLPISQDSLP